MERNGQGVLVKGISTVTPVEMWGTEAIQNGKSKATKEQCSCNYHCVTIPDVIIVRIVFIHSFLFYWLLSSHRFPTNPNSFTNCFKPILFLLQLHCSCVAFRLQHFNTNYLSRKDG